MGWGNESLFVGSGSHDQDGRHVHIWEKPFKNLLQNQRTNDLVAWYVALRTRTYHSFSNEDPRLTLTYFTARSNLVPYAFVCPGAICMYKNRQKYG